MHYIFALGSSSKRKEHAVKNVLRKLEINNYSLELFDAFSGVSNQPMDNEVQQGAINRAQQTKQYFGSAIMAAIGIEYGYRSNTDGSLSALAWCSIVSHKEYIIKEHSTSHRVPHEIAEELLQRKNMDTVLTDFYPTLSHHELHNQLAVFLHKDQLLEQAVEAAIVSFFTYKERQRCAGVVIHKNNLLVLKHILGEEIYYILPGGGREIGETTVEASQREVLEETSVTTIPTNNYITLTAPPTRDTHFYHVLQYVDGEPMLHPQSPEALSKDKHSNLEAMWIPIEQLAKLELKPSVIKELLLTNPDLTTWEGQEYNHN